MVALWDSQPLLHSFNGNHSTNPTLHISQFPSFKIYQSPQNRKILSCFQWRPKSLLFGLVFLFPQTITIHGLNFKFTPVVVLKISPNRRVSANSMGVWGFAFGGSLGIILAMDKLLKQAFLAASIKFPSALFGMFCIFSILMILDSTFPTAAISLMNFFEPLPSLVVLLLAVKDIPAASGVKIIFIIGWLASLSVAGYTAISVRNMVKTEMIEAEPIAKPAPFSSIEVLSWAGVFLNSFIAALLYPTVLGTNARTCLPSLLASTVLGYMISSGLPSNVKKVFHPIICCALSADLAAAAFGYLSKSGLNPVLGTSSLPT
ncbi:hypothetical protein RJ641_000817 [Dillenia turbinata]|uniref:Uncharacterized protein n=1 Tax=Dillenia turbinata TaxID=194707 RepID=A0AAN8WCM5_9MAGN